MQLKKAEILLALQTLMTSTSQKSVESFVQLTNVIFPDSIILDK